MKFSENWLREWVNPPITTAQLAEQLTMAGLEVDSITKLAGDFNGVMVGQVLECEQHPNADRLRVCKVTIGSEVLPIVCGAANVRAGLKVAVATVGAVLPGGFTIRASKLRGEPSYGMICSAAELGMNDNDAVKGIMELADDAPIGIDFRVYKDLNDAVIDIELTPNRGDCASVLGVAREVSVLNSLPLIEPLIEEPVIIIEDTYPVSIEHKAGCPHYMGCVIRGIDATAKTPAWMITRLEQCGSQPIHPVVDVCNYVMFELGQPMHAFDLAALDSEIKVRLAEPNETIRLLNEQEIILQGTELVVADCMRPQAIAGIMGGLGSSVSEATTHIFLESAFFDPIAVSLTARRLGLVTDSSYRFERGVDHQLQRRALCRAIELLQNIVGGEVGPITDITSQEHFSAEWVVVLRRERIQKLLGLELSDNEVARILTSLGMTLNQQELGWQVTIPSYRSDIKHEIDLVEELARIHGYDNIPVRDLEAPLRIQQPKETSFSPERMTDFLVDAGYHEVVTYSFVDETLQKLIEPGFAPISILNPISNDMNVMRNSLWPGLIQTMQYNQNRQIPRLRLFETGLRFWDAGAHQIIQENTLALLACGPVSEEQWGISKRIVDFFDVKGELECLFRLMGQFNIHWEPGTHSALHPGQSANFFVGSQLLGVVGAMHPRLVKELDLRETPILAQLDLNVLLLPSIPQYQPLSKFPGVRRDLALVVDENLPAAAILSKMKEAGANNCNLLNNITIFDVYQGGAIEAGKKSIAVGLTFQDPSRTLIEADIHSAIESIIKVLEDEFKATLRM